MAKITLKDYETLQSGLRELYAHHDLNTLPRAALRLACALVPNDLGGYNEVDPLRNRLQVVFEPDHNLEEYIRLVPLWEKWMHQHPVLAHYRKNPNDGPRKVSDFLTDDDFRKLELHSEFYRRIKCNYQIAANMPSPSPLVVAIALNRETHDFTERDRGMLDLMRPHLRQAYENAVIVTELSSELGRAYDALERMDRGIALVDDNRQVLSASPAAVRFSVEQFPGDSSASLARRLPETLDGWAAKQIDALTQSSADLKRPQPLILEGPSGRLVVRLSSDREPYRYLLTMHQARPLESAEPLEDLGLTRREAEVLHRMIAGKSNQEIGSTLDISERTVDKHAQNLYGKLEVAGRAEAITKALEWLRL